MEQNIATVVASLTTEEKATLCVGATYWLTAKIDRLSIPEIMVSDGPYGLRKQEGNADHLGIYDSVPATCFPPGCAIASSWDKELVERMGVALGEEAQAEGVDIILGPGTNIKRHPLCGRNFEYLSEDPVLSGHIAAAWVDGVQSQGVGTSLKHFAVNNQESFRNSTNVTVDERTLREIYLPAFEYVVKHSNPSTIMGAYNRLDGKYLCENKRMLTDILRDEWGFEGLVVSDWCAVVTPHEAIKAGCDLEMPTTGGYSVKRVVKAVEQGELFEGDLDKAVTRVLKQVQRSVASRKSGTTYDKQAHHALARDIAAQSIILLKNEDKALPISDKVKRIAIVGMFAKQPRFQGGGSAHVNPTSVETAYDELTKLVGEGVNITYNEGYHPDHDADNAALITAAKQSAADADIAIVFAGLPDSYESEGFDRPHMDMPTTHVNLINEVAIVQSNTVVVLSNGSPVTMTDWQHNVKAILECYLMGQANGAVADILVGRANPCGKLAETMPLDLTHTPAYLNFPGCGEAVHYAEGIYVGYRYYDTRKMPVMYPFGHGLSYTSFEYSDIAVDKESFSDSDTLTVTCSVKNTGEVFGREVVQLYISDEQCMIDRPQKELKAFAKVTLEPQQSKTVTFVLSKRDFAFYNVPLKQWTAQSGAFTISIASSSRDIRLTKTVQLNSGEQSRLYTRFSTIEEVRQHPYGDSFINGLMEKHSDIIHNIGLDPESDESGIAQVAMRETPLCKIQVLSRGIFNEQMLKELIDRLNEQ